MDTYENLWQTFWLFVVVLAASAGCRPELESIDASQDETVSQQNTTSELVVEAACGQCKFGLSGDGCDLAMD